MRMVKKSFLAGLMLVLFGILVQSSTAHALSRTWDWDPDLLVTGGGGTSMYFNQLSDNPFTAATLTLSVGEVTGGTFMLFGMNNAGIVWGTGGAAAGGGFPVGNRDYTFSSADGTLNLEVLNNSIWNYGGEYGNRMSLQFQQLVGSTVLQKATISGTVAPEPVSMALVASGLVGLPFVRRFRNLLR